MQIAVLGVGSIGSGFAFQLVNVGGHDVTTVARPDSPRLKQLERDQAIVKTTGERATVSVTDKLDEQKVFDLVIVTLLSHQVEAVLPALQRSAARRILFMFNNFEPGKLRDAIGADRSSFGMPFIQATLNPEGMLDAKIGVAGQKSMMDNKACLIAFNEAGLPAVLESDMLLWLRCHVPLAVAFESISVAGVRRGGGASWAESMTIARGVQESFTLIKRLGYQIYPRGKWLMNASPVWIVAAMLWSISRLRSFRELLATGINECRALVDVLAANASLVQPSVSVDKILAMKPSI